ncbi:hypothetical protein NQ176_g2823 [Zarea fungicola]|uniref:Uncharacterized protein n=1 Tax=Zarea fungicola TaxID=93591 RepID=A0ACC1NLH3_9HYPO|nr:hypothetical protein NQ176_g2823 [Lecanicillium fungicola]
MIKEQLTKRQSPVLPNWHPQLRDALRRLSTSKLQLLQLIANANPQCNDPSRSALVKDIKCRIMVHKMRALSFIGLDNAMGEFSTRLAVRPDGTCGLVAELDWDGGHIEIQLDMPDGSLRPS